MYECFRKYHWDFEKHFFGNRPFLGDSTLPALPKSTDTGRENAHLLGSHLIVPIQVRNVQLDMYFSLVGAKSVFYTILQEMIPSEEADSGQGLMVGLW